MSHRQRSLFRLAFATAALGLALAAAGCESLDAINPFVEKEKKLPGTRVEVFPQGVPGVDYNAPPQQPASPGGYVTTPTPESPTAGAAQDAK